MLLNRHVEIKLQSSESILTTGVDPRTVRLKLFMMVVHPEHRYSNELERDNEDTYDDFKLKTKQFGCHVFLQINSAL